MTKVALAPELQRRGLILHADVTNKGSPNPGDAELPG